MTRREQIAGQARNDGEGIRNDGKEARNDGEGIRNDGKEARNDGRRGPASLVKLMLTSIKERIVTMQLPSTKTPLLMDAKRKFSLPSTKTPLFMDANQKFNLPSTKTPPFVDGNRKLMWN